MSKLKFKAAVAKSGAMEADTISKNGGMEFRVQLKKRLIPKIQLKTWCLFFIILLFGRNMYGQDGQQVFLGLGSGLDFGGIGGKIEYLPVKHLGIFGGLGYNLVSVGWNVGATFKIMPDKRVSPNLMFLYGYNKVFITFGVPEYNLTTYGVTIGGNLDVKIGRKGNKLSVGLLVPIKSQEYKDHLEIIKNDAIVDVFFDLPVAICVGYNFKLNK